MATATGMSFMFTMGRIMIVNLNVFRVDSPMKGKYSAKDETVVIISADFAWITSNPKPNSSGMLMEYQAIGYQTKRSYLAKVQRYLLR